MNLQLVVANPTGLHARPAALFTATARRFQSTIRVRNLSTDSDWADAKSVLSVLAVGAENGHAIELSIEGPDEKEAAEALRRAVESGLGESPGPVAKHPVGAAGTGPASSAPAPAPAISAAASDRILRGIPGAPGLAIGPVRRWQESSLRVPRLSGRDPVAEAERLNAARAAARRELEALQAKVAAEAGPEESRIFEAHQMFLDDLSLFDVVNSYLQQGVNAEAAWMDGIQHISAGLERLPDPTLAGRAADVRDIGERVLRHLQGERFAPALDLTQPAIIVARDLTPSQTAALDKSRVLAFCTAEGGPTAHTAILARALQIPAVVGLGERILPLADGDQLIVEGGSGQVTLRPTAEEIQIAHAEQARLAEISRSARAAAAAPAVTRDGRHVEVFANIGDAEGGRKALEYGAEGVGLLRTEFLYLQRQTAPSEDEQYEAYRAIFEVMQQRPVIVRTLDVGGDKMLPYLDLGPEANPFLGARAIRLCLRRPDIFQPQLRALLRAAAGHDVRIMFPMIAVLEEVLQARAAVEEARAALKSKKIEAAAEVQLGMMVEIPSAAVMAEAFAREVDFFSIGTNDLTQYTLAAERTNPNVAHLGDALHPAVLRLIKQVTDAAHAAGRRVGVCGELAGDVEAIPILVGLEVDELSMTPALIPQAKAAIRTLDADAARRLAGEALALDGAEAVRARARKP